jgi:hypothetical protein
MSELTQKVCCFGQLVIKVRPVVTWGDPLND